MSQLNKNGGYRNLKSFQMSTIIYDATYWFCEKYFDKYSRMKDQMIQAARSGRQNIAEGSKASGTSTQTELRLTNVARASLEELLLDYEDFIRHRKALIWPLGSEEVSAVRAIAFSKEINWKELTQLQRSELYSIWLEDNSGIIRANALICIIHQTNYLLDRQINYLEKSFVERGGYTEKLAKERIDFRRKTGEESQECPECKSPMVVKTAKNGQNQGKQFWGCSSFPKCRSLVNI